MISFRYHLVSIVAVFAALAVGIIAGSTVVKQSLVDSTEQNLERTERQLAEISAERDELGRQLDEYEDFSAAASTALLTDRLAGVPLVVLEGTGVEDPVRAGIGAALELAGTSPIARIRLDDSIGDDDAALRMAGALDSSAREDAQLRAELGRAVGGSIAELAAAVGASRQRQELDDRPVPTTTTQPATTDPSVPPTDTAATGEVPPLATAAPTTTAGSAEGPTTEPAPTTTSTTTTTTVPLEVDPGEWLTAEPLEALDRANLVRVEDIGGEIVPDERLVVLVVLDRRSGVTVHDVVVAALTELARTGVAVVVAEAGLIPDDDETTSESVVAIVRDDGELRDAISTVDDAEGVAGWFGVVLAVEERVEGGVGQYGRRDGSRGLLPTPT